MSSIRATSGVGVPTFARFVPEIAERLQRVADTYLESYDEHHAFVYLVAELYETTHQDKFVFTDGPYDGGIDFFIRDAPSYSICQCKCPQLDALQPDARAPRYDRASVNELSAAVNMLLDRTGEYRVSREVRQLRGDYQRDRRADSESTTMTAILAVLGELTDQAHQAFQSSRSSLASQGVRLKLVEWRDIYRGLHSMESPADVDCDVEIHFDDENDLLAHRDYCYVLAHAFDFYEGFRRHEWNLFDWNVRYQIPKSPINKRIMETLSKRKGRARFHHYNNGLLITCKNYRKDTERLRLRVSGAQVVNGCQTVRAICEAYESLSPADQDDFRQKARVQAKIITTTDPEFIGELVISTNDQNPMNPRNLKSNSNEQRDIQKSFRDLPSKWFYERKDGEFQSLRVASSRVRWFRKSDYAVARRHFRVLDNQDLAKAWYAFIGHSHTALRGGVNYFDDEHARVYSTVFKSVPSPAFWSAFKETQFVPDDSYLEPGIPYVYQYLLAQGISKYIDARRISFRANKTEAVKRGIADGVLRGDPETGRTTSTSREVDEFLAGDLDYNLNIMVNNMREVLIELFSFLLCRKYAACDALTAQKLLTAFPREAQYLRSGFSRTEVPGAQQDGSSFLGPTYDFLMDCVKQYYFEFEAEIRAAPRRKSYLAQRSTVNRLRAVCVRRNGAIRGYDEPWKRVDATFLESLPELPRA